MIGAQSLFAYRVSISDHKLTIIATDVYPEPVDVDYIFMHSGECYNFALKPKTVSEVGRDYLIRAETIEVDLTKSVPYPSLGRIAEAILHYAPNIDEQKSIALSHIDQWFTSEQQAEAKYYLELL
eukprot:Em0001g603a